MLGETKVWLDGTESREQFLCLVILDGRRDDDIPLWLPLTTHHRQTGDYLPVNGGDERVLVIQLKRVNDTEDFLRVTAGAGGVVDDCADDLLGIDEEDGSDGQGHALAVDVGRVLVVDHVVQVGHLARLVGDDGEREVRLGDLVDVLDPFLVRVERVGVMNGVLVVTLVRLGFSGTAFIPPRSFMYLSLQQCHPCTFCPSSGVFLLALPHSPSSASFPEHSRVTPELAL